MTAACGCGFSAFIQSTENTQVQTVSEPEQDSFISLWTKSLLRQLQEENDDRTNRIIMHELAAVHYDKLEMNKLLERYRNKLPEFLTFLREEWGWRITWDDDRKHIIADEDKKQCVCPLMASLQNPSSILCYCSEGFAERMFSRILGKKVRAKVITSILRGDARCQYQIDYK